MIGHLYTLLFVSGEEVATPKAGKGSRKTLADYEVEWANAEKQPEATQARRRIKREAARVLYTETIALPPEQRARLTDLQARKEAATLAETKALLDLMVTTSGVRAEIARAAARIARRQAEEAARLIEELDVMYVAAVLAEA
jgi:membrane protein involved in colicin uptake